MTNIEEFPPIPTQLLWMIDGVDRKAATKMIHDYTAAAITWRPSKALLGSWERVQQAEDRARRLEDEIDRLQKRVDLLSEYLQEFVSDDQTPEQNCSCHISPPCNDCVENSWKRELVKDSRAALAAPSPEEPLSPC